MNHDRVGNRHLSLLVAGALAANPATAASGSSDVGSIVDQAAASFYRAIRRQPASPSEFTGMGEPIPIASAPLCLAGIKI